MRRGGFVTVLSVPRYEIECSACGVIGTARAQRGGKVLAADHIGREHPDDDWPISTTYRPAAS